MRDSLYSTGLLPSSHSGVDASAGHACIARPSASFSYQQQKHTENAAPAFFFAAARLSNRSGISPEDPKNVTKFKSLGKLTKRQSE